MNYFYIKINNNIDILKDTVELIKQYNLEEKSLSIIIKKDSINNCTLDKDNNFHLKVYSDNNKINYKNFKKYYLNKYLITETDLDVILHAYPLLNIDSIEICKVRIKINYNFSMINALQFIIDLIGKDEDLSKLLNINGELFNQLVNNFTESENFIIENNHIYISDIQKGQYFKKEKIEKDNNHISKYIFLKSLDKILEVKNKEKSTKI